MKFEKDLNLCFVNTDYWTSLGNSKRLLIENIKIAKKIWNVSMDQIFDAL